jgi:alkanesulfonate monooxygenase SsuD/methylene tetrahydromethanopterin reductase-like flavin-dependent oxidoreductase (luciferase family)
VSAREIVELDLVSGGRAEIGLRDAGSAALAEAMTVCKKLWCDPTVEHRGACFELDETALERRPAQRPWPRLHLAGESHAALDRAARLADGWLAVGHSPESIVAPLARGWATSRARGDARRPLPGRARVDAADPAG